MARALATVFGGTGFLGQAIVRDLVEHGMQVRVAVRHPDRASFDGLGAHVSVVQADIRNEDEAAAALKDAVAVVNVVGLYVERGPETFDAVHVRGAMHVARQAALAGAKRLVLVSGIGADPASPSRYVRARAEGEQRVRERFERACIVRPSVLFGRDDAFLCAIDRITGLSPVFPLFGHGLTRLQPVYVGDVARAVASILVRSESPAELYELGGAGIHTYREIVDMVLTHRGRRRLLVPVPYGLWMAQARMMALLPQAPLTEDQVILMRGDNVVGDGVSTFEHLGIEPRSVEAMLPDCLGPSVHLRR